MDNKTILVNGTLYDAVTGMPVVKQETNQAVVSPETRRTQPSHNVHARAEAPRTANRRVAPSAITTPVIQKRTDKKRVIQPTATKNPSINRFAPRPATVNRSRVMSDIRPATPHPLAKRAEERIQQARQQQTPVAMKPSSVIKNEAISQALDKAPRHNTIKPKRSLRNSRVVSFASVALSLLLLTGYLTYINLPNLSVRVAASQAGINATYPGYKPDGYRLAGVNYDQGSVSLKFAANAGPQNFTITQQQTSWDSTAVKENYVKTNWGDDVVPYSERGLTIYAHEGNAAWVNGGILYTITGDAPLSTSQVRSVATSL